MDTATEAKAPAGHPVRSGSHWRAKIGFVLLATEQTIQDDVMKLRPEGVGIHFTRAAIPDSITNATPRGTRRTCWRNAPRPCCPTAASTSSAMPAPRAAW